MTKTLNLKPIYALALFIIAMGVILPALNNHAVERHANDAIRAYNHVKKNGSEHCRWECSDGRIRYICPLNHRETNGVSLYAVVVLIAGATAGTYKLVTAFICRKDYAKSLTEKGKNHWQITHP